MAWDVDGKQPLTVMQPMLVLGIIASAVERYPQLAGWLPQRPASARTCGTCGGKGHLAGMPNVVCNECFGLGWTSPDLEEKARALFLLE